MPPQHKPPNTCHSNTRCPTYATPIRATPIRAAPTQATPAHAAPTCAPSHTAAALAALLVQIVLLNMLIVMMREVYRKIRDNERDVFLRGRAQLIVEVETLMGSRERDKYMMMPPYLHQLRQVQYCWGGCWFCLFHTAVVPNQG